MEANIYVHLAGGSFAQRAIHDPLSNRCIRFPDNERFSLVIDTLPLPEHCFPSGGNYTSRCPGEMQVRYV